MAPAFSSRQQALAFALLLLAVLGMPAISARLGLFSRPDGYAVMPAGAGDFAYLRQQIFREKSDLDILFMGTSRLIYGIKTPYVQQELSARLGRETRVITLGSFLEGEDRTYLVLRDLLQHRKVKLLVLNTVWDGAWHKDHDFARVYDQPHPWLYHFFQLGPDSEAMADLPFRSQAALYAGVILGFPRHLLSRFRRDLVEEEPPSAKGLGSEPKFMAYRWDDPAFAPFTPPHPHFPPEAMIYSAESWPAVPCSHRAIGPYPAHFVYKIGQLLRENGVHLVILHLPSLSSDGRIEPILEAAQWPQLFGVPAELVRAPPELFTGLTDTEIKKLWCDDEHLNANGMDFFTRVIAPAVLELYGNEAKP